MQTQKIALIGEAMIELSGVAFGEIHQTYGGDVLNTAIYIARLINDRAQVYFFSALGDDSISNALENRWQAQGVLTDYVLRDAQHHVGLYLIQVDAQGERRFLYWRNDSAARYWLQHRDSARLIEALAEMDTIYLSGISLAILPEKDKDHLLKILHQLVEKGHCIVFDSNYRPHLWESPEAAQYYYQQIYQLGQIALVTREDEALLWADASVEQIFHRLQYAGVQQVVIKAGAEGCYYQKDNQLIHLPAKSVKKVIDSTAAGDAFNAGFLAAYLVGKEIEEAAKIGNEIASLVIQYPGAIIDESITESVKTQFFETISSNSLSS